MNKFRPTIEPRDPSDEEVTSICIVGGGTAGWMAAATLRRRMKCDVTLVESDRIPSVGVGEATIPAMLDWIENMRLDEDDFIRRCCGTYKLAIRFDNWITPNHRYWHPFGVCGFTIDDIDLVHFWKRGMAEGWLSPNTQYTDFSFQKTLCDLKRAPRQNVGAPIIANYAFHLDAAKLAEYLRELAISEGVKHRTGDVAGCEFESDGSIARVLVTDQSPIEADLFIDCSGFAGALIEKSLHVPWIDWSHQLICDRAVTLRLPHDEGETNPYTISTGLNAGWAWQIPLHDRIGVGYVYSSRHLSSDAARDELIAHMGIHDNDVVTRELKMRIGRRAQSWVKNCVAIGLSSGFIEPLESTGIFLVQRALDDLFECLPKRPHDPPLVDEFNRRMIMAYEEVRDFVLLHYVVSERTDTPFWRESRAVELPESLSESMRLYETEGAVRLPPGASVFAEANHHFIMTGAGRVPGMADAAMDRGNMPNTTINRAMDPTLISLLGTLQQQNVDIAKQLPSHRVAIDQLYRQVPLTAGA